MRLAVPFGTDCWELEIESLLGARVSPTTAGDSGPDQSLKIRTSLEEPRDYPPLRQIVVPGDRVVLPLEPDIPGISLILAEACSILRESGVLPSDITVLSTSAADSTPRGLSPGVSVLAHNPDDAKAKAYLANTSKGRRIYLDRLLTDADVVIPIGRLGLHRVLGFRGPWSVLYPASSDRETLRTFENLEWNHAAASSTEQEVAEVSWLLGAQFQIGVEVGRNGFINIEAGAENAIRSQLLPKTRAAWELATHELAQVGLAGIGVPWKPTTFDDLTTGLAAVSDLVQPGGKVVALTQFEGPLGPAMDYLSKQENLRPGFAALKGLENQPDYPAARRLVQVLSHAKVYLLSRLDESLVEDLGLTPISSPQELKRLISDSSCAVMSPAELMRGLLLAQESQQGESPPRSRRNSSS